MFGFLRKTEKKPVPKKKVNKKLEKVMLVTDHKEPETIKVPTKKAIKPICSNADHHCMAIDLTNRMLCMIEDFEKNIERIQKHPSIDEQTKRDIQNYINKTLITSLWAISPAFDLMKSYPRYKSLRSLYLKSFNAGAPGILTEKKHI